MSRHLALLVQDKVWLPSKVAFETFEIKKKIGLFDDLLVHMDQKDA